MLGEICAVCSVRYGKIFFFEKKRSLRHGKIFFSERKKGHCKSVRWQKSVNALPLARGGAGDNRAMA